MTIKELDNQLNDYKGKEKARIKAEKSRFKRFWMWLWYFLILTWKWLWMSLKDWHTLIIFIAVVLVVGSEVWVPFLLGIIFNNSYLLGIAGICEAFWLAPLTPFIPLCLFLTICIKSLTDKIKARKQGN